MAAGCGSCSADDFRTKVILIMIRLSPWWSCLTGTCVLALASVGCRPEAPTTTAAARPPAVESFDQIVQIMTRALETGTTDIPGGFVSNDMAGRSRFSVSNKVTSKLVPPAAPDENYRGTITVTSRTSYSLRRSDDADGDKGREEAESHDNGFSLLDDPDAANQGFGSTDDGLVTATPAEDKSATSPSDTVTSRTDEDVRTFEMEYLKGRWVLLTQPDPETERSIQKAFDYALGRQR
jgi:hypothetical protein